MKVFKFEVDEQFAREHNEMFRDNRQLRTAGIVLGVLVAIGAILYYFFGADNPSVGMIILILGIVMGVVFALVGVTIGKRFGQVQDIYDTYPLAPAVVAEVGDKTITLLSLVNTNVDPELPPRWALAEHKIKALPGVKEPKVGMQVPSVAVHAKHSNHDRGHWQQIKPMPIAWATPDDDLVNTARRSIPHEQWQKLDRGRSKLNDVRATPENLLVL